MSFGQLALRIGVTEQAVRHWESGRSYPGKSKAKIVEEALGIQLDWTEGEGHGDRETAASMIRHADIELLIKLCQLPMEIKMLFGKLADQYAGAQTAAESNNKETESIKNEKFGNVIQPFMTESRPIAGALAMNNLPDTINVGASVTTGLKKQRRSSTASR